MKRIAILSDTHGFWDAAIEHYLHGCDEVWHAGDIGSIEVVERMEELVPVVRAVCGNADYGMVRRRCNELEIFEVEGMRVLLTHVGGYPGRWSRGMKKLLADNNIGLMVDGHSHILKIIYDRELKLLNINPGAAGQQGWHKQRTMVRLTIDGSDMRDAEVVELGHRGA